MDFRGKNTRKDSLELGKSWNSSVNHTDTEEREQNLEYHLMHTFKQVASSEISYYPVLDGYL